MGEKNLGLGRGDVIRPNRSLTARRVWKELIDASKRDKLRITEEFRMAISEKDRQVEVLNKDSDKLKLKYDMLMAEKDELNAQIQNLSAQLSSKGDRIRQSRGGFTPVPWRNVKN
ncbi:hypothetical protein MLD38_009555 [Melastoma candidum]|uniref:Uncharacterized protein n=1 Tax=Melastoma candidum TaxID=119954 RepID=A0ACB9RZF0_9MYRT|nr:hypothetical protein MLD38_009555 [Melastoma candidum]